MYVVKIFGVVMDRFLGIKNGWAFLNYFNPDRLMWCLPYQSVSLMFKMLLAHDLVDLIISCGENYVYVVFYGTVGNVRFWAQNLIHFVQSLMMLG